VLIKKSKKFSHIHNWIQQIKPPIEFTVWRRYCQNPKTYYTVSYRSVS